MPTTCLIDFTGKGTPNPVWHAADILIFTKSTRLTMAPEGLEQIERLPEETKLKELEQMAKTIPSSWEFVDLTFLFSGVTRACAQQITRTRNASYSMQSQRIVDMSDAVVTNPFPHPALHGEAPISVQSYKLCKTFQHYSDTALKGYQALIEQGADAQDARGLLPMNTQCNLVAKYNLRAFVELVRSRSSLRTQQEYAQIVTQAVDCAKAVWPWITLFLKNPKDEAIKDLEAIAKELGVVPGTGAGWRIAKALDMLRKA
jgi:flavin-dependent thymidylate synthase